MINSGWPAVRTTSSPIVLAKPARMLTALRAREAADQGEIEAAIVSGRTGPDWGSLAARAGRQISNEDLHARGLSQEKIDAVRARYGG